MKVRFVTVSNANNRRPYVHDVDSALKSVTENHEWDRIAFGGRTEKGRAGVAINLFSGDVSGHKIDPIPKKLVPLVRHVLQSDVRKGLGYLLAGEDVLIGSETHGVLLRRYGDGIEVFGSGDDSYQPLP